MRIIIDIPEQFESDYKGDMFKDFFSRVMCDIQDGTLCGNYEKETVEMLMEAFDESIPMDRIVEELEEDKTCRCRLEGYIPKWKAIEIVKEGGTNG